MEMPSGHNPTRSIAWKMPSVPINLTLGGPYVTAGRTVGPRPPATLRRRWVFAMPRQIRLGRAPAGSRRRKPRAPAPGRKAAPRTVPRRCHRYLDTPNTPKLPSWYHIPASRRAPPEQPKGHPPPAPGLHITISIPTPPNSHDFNPSCRNRLFPFLSALLRAPSPELPCKPGPASSSPPGMLQPRSRRTQPVSTPFKIRWAYLSPLSLCREGTADTPSTEQKLVLAGVQARAQPSPSSICTSSGCKIGKGDAEFPRRAGNRNLNGHH